jgi:hypothetical protein
MRALICIALTACVAAPSAEPQPEPPPPQQQPGSPPDDGDSPPSRADVELSVPIRRQWENGHGYCGETSVQAIAMSYGAWISQRVVRDVAGGELLLGVNDEAALAALHLTHVAWDPSAASPQAAGFEAWIKRALEARTPVVYANYITDGDDDPDYDHIVPAFGVLAGTADGVAPTDVLISSDNFGQRIELPFGELAATRAGCARASTAGGCIPVDVDYGVAITGIAGADRPVRLVLAGDTEPNVSLGAQPAQLAVMVVASELTVGATYALQRADGYDGAYRDVTTFIATADSWTYTDAQRVRSDQAAYYRCVAR